MPLTAGERDAARSVVFAPLDGAGRAQLVAQRLMDGIVSGMLRDGERLPSESDLARSMGVAVTTAREALEVMRDQGLLRTRRGRDGGSFVTYDRDAAAVALEERLRGVSRIELRDLALHMGAIEGTAAEEAADRASEDDIRMLRRIHESAEMLSPGGARRAAARFALEVAAVSQSPRLVREEIRIQGEAGPIVWLCLREPDHRARNAEARERVVDAIARVAPEEARAATLEPIQAALEWLVDQKLRRDPPADPLEWEGR